MGALFSFYLRTSLCQFGGFMARASQGSIIKDNVLHPKRPETKPDISCFGDKSAIEVIFEAVEERLATGEDYVFLQNGAKVATGESQAFGRSHIMLSEVIPLAKRVAKVMYHKYGVRRNDVVQLVMTNSCDFYWPVYGAFLCLAAVSPSDPTLTPEVLVHQMEEIKPKLVFCCEYSKERVKKAVQSGGFQTTIVQMDGRASSEGVISFEDFIKDSEDLPDVPRESCKLDDVSIIAWSSGSTGKPKGIQHTHEFTMYSWLKSMVAERANPGSRMINIKKNISKFFFGGGFLLTTCFFHMGGFVMGGITGLLADGLTMTFVAPEDIDDQGIELLYPVIDLAKPVFMAMGSHHCAQLATAPLPPPSLDTSSVLITMPLGANTYKGIEADMRKRLPYLQFLLNLYGQSEIPVAVSMALDQDSIGSVGSQCRVKIRDTETDEALGPGKVGEIMAKPDIVMKGYLNRPEENAKFFGKDGWIHTGDLGHYDEKGILHYDSRLKELMKYRNTHLYPIEIEEVIRKIPGVVEVGVFGRPDPIVQELITAIVVREEGSELSEEKITEFVDERVEDFKRLRGGVCFVEKLPRNPQGKILRRKLAEYWKE